MTPELFRRTGFELELLAPAGSSRRTLADALAAECAGQVRVVWHEDSEPSPAPILGGRFLHLTQGFEVVDHAGSPVCTIVDDVTIVAGLNPRAPAPAGWHRVLTDDPRLLRLLATCCDPAAPLDVLLDPAARLWGVVPDRRGDIWSLDVDGASIALAAPAGGERERPSEIVTPALSADHERVLDRLLGPARSLGFTVPQEAAVHLHLDGTTFRDPATLANVIRLFAHWREPLRTVLGTNPACRRLAPLPAELVAVVAGHPSYDELRAAAKAGGLTKFFDINLTQLFRDVPIRNTLEVRILPGSIEARDVVEKAALVESLLFRCLAPEPIPSPSPDLLVAIGQLRELGATARHT